MDRGVVKYIGRPSENAADIDYRGIIVPDEGEDDVIFHVEKGVKRPFIGQIVDYNLNKDRQNIVMNPTILPIFPTTDRRDLEAPDL